MGHKHVPFWPDRYETPRVLYVSTFGLDTKSGPHVSGEEDARDTSSQLKLWDLRAGLSACKMCPYGAHLHLAVLWV